MSSREYGRSVQAIAATVLVAGLMLVSPLPRDPEAGTTSPKAAGSTGIDEAARAARSGDCDAARRLASPAPADGVSQGERAVIAGLYALACGQPEEARDLLLVAAGRAEGFEDWRLFALAEAAAQTGNDEESLAAADRLIERIPVSPLRRSALVLAAEVSARSEEPIAALSRFEAAWTASPGREDRERLANAAWAAVAGDRPLEQRVARRLLVEEPLLAAELEVVEVFRQANGTIPWTDFSSVEDLENRATALRRAGLATNSLMALEEVPEESRGIAWQLSYAESLIDSHRGVEALGLLERLGPQWRGVAGGEAEWLAARAALDAARVRRGRRNLAAGERETMASRARTLLASVARRKPAGPRSLQAHELWVAALAKEDDLDATRVAARELTAVDPTNWTAAGSLWKLSWQRYEEDEFATALALWEELDTPGRPIAMRRAARYWSARAWEEMDESERAARVFAELAAPGPTDFYRRQAVRRTGVDLVAAARERPPVDEWPEDSLLDRAARLSELGLDDFALLELEALELPLESRARSALEARILGRQGEPRESIRRIRRAFPALGTALQETAPAEALRLYYPLEFIDVIRAEALERGLPESLVLAMIRQESAFDASARSSAGARGLMQLMPATGRELAGRLGIPYSRALLGEPDFSVRLGTTYFRQVLDMFDRSEELALAGYNAGPYRIRRLWRQAGGDAEVDRFVEGLPLSETRSYVKRVLLFADSYGRLYG